MICLDITDTLEAWSDTNAVIDCSIHGLVGTTFTNLYTGTLNNTPNTVIYTAGAAISVVSATFVNTAGAAATVNFKLDPANGGNDKFLLPVAVSLGAGYALVFDGQRFSMMDTSGQVVTSFPVALPLTVPNGGTGRATSTTAYALLAAGTTATGAHQTLPAGATTEVLVGGGAGALPAWGTNIPTAVTIGSKYIYRADGTDVPVADGGTGASTLTDHGILLGSGAGAITPMAALGAGQLIYGVAGADPAALGAGATTKILVGGGAAAPVWTTATGSGAPVRATSPTLVTPALGTPSSGVLTNCTGLNIVTDTTPELGGEMDAGAHTIGFTQQTATGDGTTTIDWKLGNKFFFTYGAQNDTFTFTAPSNPCNLLLVLKQDGGGSRTPTWPATVKWPTAGTEPTWSSGGGEIDIVSFYYDGTSYFGQAGLDFQ